MTWRSPPFYRHCQPLILSGAVVAILLRIFQVLKMDWRISKEQFHFQYEGMVPITGCGFSPWLLMVLAIYLIGDNIINH